MDEEFGKLIEPAPVAFQFGAPGWYVLTVIILLILAAIAWFLIAWYRKNRYRRVALKKMVNSESALSGQPSQLLYETNMLLKQIAMYRYGRSTAAALKGDEWIGFLNSTSRRELFSAGDYELLKQQLYVRGANETGGGQVGPFLHKAKLWVRQHGRIKKQKT